MNKQQDNDNFSAYCLLAALALLGLAILLAGVGA